MPDILTITAEKETRMVDPPHYSDSKPHKTPRWVKVFGIIALVVVLLIVILLLTRGPGGGHGPSLHTGADDSSVTEDHTPPQAAHP